MFDGELIDEHFSTLSKDDDIYVLFHFSSEETKELPVTEIDDGLLFEVVIKFGEGGNPYISGESTIIEDQQPI